jgi:hypothetical protein
MFAEQIVFSKQKVLVLEQKESSRNKDQTQQQKQFCEDLMKLETI